MLNWNRGDNCSVNIAHNDCDCRREIVWSTFKRYRLLRLNRKARKGVWRESFNLAVFFGESGRTSERCFIEPTGLLHTKEDKRKVDLRFHGFLCSLTRWSSEKLIHLCTRFVFRRELNAIFKTGGAEVRGAYAFSLSAVVFQSDLCLKPLLSFSSFISQLCNALPSKNGCTKKSTSYYPGRTELDSNISWKASWEVSELFTCVCTVLSKS